LLSTRVNLAIHFDRQAMLRTIEIEDVASRRVLSSEPQASGAPAQLAPQEHFGQAHGLAERCGSLLCFLRAMQHAARYPSTSLRLVPLPLRGRI